MMCSTSRVLVRIFSQILCVGVCVCVLQSTKVLYSDYVIWAVSGVIAIIFNGWREIRHLRRDAVGAYLVAVVLATLFICAIGLSEFSSLHNDCKYPTCCENLLVALGSLIVMWNIVKMVLRLSEKQSAEIRPIDFRRKPLVVIVLVLPIAYCRFLFIAEYLGLLSPDSYDQLPGYGATPIEQSSPCFPYAFDSPGILTETSDRG